MGPSAEDTYNHPTWAAKERLPVTARNNASWESALYDTAQTDYVAGPKIPEN